MSGTSRGGTRTDRGGAKTPIVSHILLMTLYATQVSVFFAVLWRRKPRDQGKLFLQLFLGMMVGGLVLAWLMYPLPPSPAGPIP